MADQSVSIPAIYDGWHTYQTRLIGALQPLSPDQLALRASPSLRSIEELVKHMIGARARWFYQLMGEGGDTFATLGAWDRPEMPSRSAADLVAGLETTWQGMHAAIGRWTPTDWQQTYQDEDDGEPVTITRSWIIWHLIEHDLHHGGEIGITLGMHGLPAPDL